MRIIEEEADELSELQQEQEELDRLLDERGRINLEFTVGSSAGANPVAEAALAEMAEGQDEPRQGPEEGGE